MKKTIIYTIFVSAIILIGSIACTDSNKGYKEYYNSMGNNPVQVIPWLMDVRKSLNKNEARISSFKLEGKKYYTVEVFIFLDKHMTSSYTIYEAHDKEKNIYYHSDDILASEKDPIYKNFIEQASSGVLLWSNEKRMISIINN